MYSVRGPLIGTRLDVRVEAAGGHPSVTAGREWVMEDVMPITRTMQMQSDRRALERCPQSSLIKSGIKDK